MSEDGLLSESNENNLPSDIIHSDLVPPRPDDFFIISNNDSAMRAGVEWWDEKFLPKSAREVLRKERIGSRPSFLLGGSSEESKLLQLDQLVIMIDFQNEEETNIFVPLFKCVTIGIDEQQVL